jgi:hypothetical protein
MSNGHREQPINPFDAADLSKLNEAQQILRWYATLSDVMKQRCVDTIKNDEAVLVFINQAQEHIQHDTDGDFDPDALYDLAQRLIQKLSQQLYRAAKYP